MDRNIFHRFNPFLILTLALTFFFVFLILINNSLPTSRNNYIFLTLLILLIGLVRYPREKSIEEIAFYLFGGILLVYLSYSSMIHFPTNDFMNRNFMRFNHYFFLIIYIFIFRKSVFYTSTKLSMFLVLIHALFFHLNSEKAVYMIPYLSLALWKDNKNIERGNGLKSPYLLVFLLAFFISMIATKPTLNQAWMFYLLGILGVLSYLGFYSLDLNTRVWMGRLLTGIFFYQGIILLSFIIYTYFKMEVDPDYSKAFLQLPISSIGAISLIVILISLIQIIKYKGLVNSIFSAANVLIYLILLMVSHSRTSFIGTMVGVFIIMSIIFWKKKKLHIFRYKFAYLSFGVLSILFLFLGVSIFQSKNIQLNTLMIRFDIWEAHILSTWQTSPIFGLGMLPEWKMFYLQDISLSIEIRNTIENYIAEFQSFPPGHSLYIQVFSSMGILGLMLIGTASLSVLIRSIKRRDYLLLGLFVAFGIHELTDYHFTEYPVFFPLLFLFSELKSKKIQKYPNINLYISSLLMLIYTILALIVIFQSILNENRQKDLSTLYDFNNLEYAIKRDNLKTVSPLESHLWVQEGYDWIYALVPDRNHVFLKLFYYKAILDIHPSYREKFLEYKGKCFAMAYYDTRCNVEP